MAEAASNCKDNPIKKHAQGNDFACPWINLATNQKVKAAKKGSGVGLASHLLPKT